ncbi:MAG: TIGR02757 family protein [Chlorobi bacterium]|nr:TIGR02757 family protein [Chlorobiota bacterium]
MNISELKTFLDEKYDRYNRPSFIETDPIQIPHSFSKKEDMEISGFLAASIAWGKRKMIIRNAEKMMSVMQHQPYDFIINADISDFKEINNIGHRTFKNVDFVYFLSALKNIYENHGGLENVFTSAYKKDKSVFSAIKYFREIFFELPHEQRTEKHIANTEKKSAAKRINMFLMWMVRNDNRGVHFGIWKDISTEDLIIPLDVHSGNTARALGMLKRKQNDKKAAEELTGFLQKLDKKDPVKYDFALFGLGVFEKFTNENTFR